MEIPDVIKKLAPDKAEFINALLQDESKGIIVARVAFLDFLLGEVHLCQITFKNSVHFSKRLPRNIEMRSVNSSRRPLATLRLCFATICAFSAPG